MHKPHILSSLMFMIATTVASVVIGIIDPFNTDRPWVNCLVLATASILGAFLATVYTAYSVDEYQDQLRDGIKNGNADELEGFERNHFTWLFGSGLLLAFIGMIAASIVSDATELTSLAVTACIVMLLSYMLNGLIGYMHVDTSSLSRPQSIMQQMRRIA